MTVTNIVIVLAVVLVAMVVFLRRDRAREIGMGTPRTGPSRPPPDGAGLPGAGLSEADRAEAARLLAAGRKIEAIKLVRERTGMGLKEAKDFVERHDFGG